MRGQISGSTRRLNKHYQSGRGGAPFVPYYPDRLYSYLHGYGGGTPYRYGDEARLDLRLLGYTPVVGETAFYSGNEVNIPQMSTWNSPLTMSSSDRNYFDIHFWYKIYQTRKLLFTLKSETNPLQPQGCFSYKQDGAFEFEIYVLFYTQGVTGLRYTTLGSLRVYDKTMQDTAINCGLNPADTGKIYYDIPVQIDRQTIVHSGTAGTGTQRHQTFESFCMNNLLVNVPGVHTIEDICIAPSGGTICTDATNIQSIRYSVLSGYR